MGQYRAVRRLIWCETLASSPVLIFPYCAAKHPVSLTVPTKGLETTSHFPITFHAPFRKISNYVRCGIFALIL